MNGVLIVNKASGYTSRDVVNIISKKFNTKKVGHTGTLDPIATGVLVVCMGNALKIIELMNNEDKEYIAKIRLGIETDTLDITGKILKEEKVENISTSDIKKALSKFKGTIKQQVPKYSAVKVDGRRLYEYARNDIDVKLPTREVNIYELDLIDCSIKDKTIEFSIKCRVSKGTYIRSLIRDIAYELNTCGVMVSLERTKHGKFTLKDAYNQDDILNDKYRLLSIKDVLDIKSIVLEQSLLEKVKNGQVLPSFFKEDRALLLDGEKEVAIYEKYIDNKVKPWKVF